MISMQTPTLADGYAVHQLIQSCPPLDVNSAYCNLLQSGHFAKTSILAKANDQCVGFISGYVKPDDAHTLFIWQVAVNASARGKGLAGKMLDGLLQRPSLQSVKYLETTITADNQASWALFTRLSHRLEARLNKIDYLDQDTHFNGDHDSESLVRIGPFEI
jgi:L-2,4-diaminobutyric acid acetyltransferase